MTASLLLFLLALTGSPPAPSAEDILERAVAAQHAGDLARTVRDFEAKAFLQRRQDGSRIDLDVVRRFRLPDRLWTQVHERAVSGARYQQGFDGKRAWLYDEVRRELVLLEGPDYRTDRQRIETDVRTMRQLLRFVFLENLVREAAPWRRLDDESRDGVHAYVVEGRARLEELGEGETIVRLWIERESGRLLGARLENERSGPIQFCFWHHRPNPQGVIVPGTVKVYRRDEPEPSEFLALEVEEDEDGRLVNAIRFNVGFPDSIFSPPEP